MASIGQFLLHTVQAVRQYLFYIPAYNDDRQLLHMPRTGTSKADNYRGGANVIIKSVNAYVFVN